METENFSEKEFRVQPDVSTLKKTFVQSVERSIFVNLFGRSLYSDWLYARLSLAVAIATNSSWLREKNLSTYVDGDYEKCLTALVACSQVLARHGNIGNIQKFDDTLVGLIADSDARLCLHWDRDHFIRE